MRRKSCIVQFVWIPSHVGIGLNETADKIAKKIKPPKRRRLKVNEPQT